MGKSSDVRFIKRVFTAYEESLISMADTPDTVLWALWAAKEASYKSVRKSHPSANSIPHRYEVHLESADKQSEAWGNVLSPYGSIEIGLYSTDQYIHCVGISEGKADWNSVVSKVEKYQFEGLSSENQSEAARGLLTHELSLHLAVQPDHIEIKRTKGPFGLDPPQLYIKGKKSATDISISHDGQFLACAFVVE